MKTMIMLILSFSLALAESEKIKLAKEYVKMNKLEKTIGNMIPQIKEMIRKMSEKSKTTSTISAYQIEEVLDNVFSTYNYAYLNSIYAEVYAETFTLKELQALVGFYKTPIGQSILDKNQIVTKKSITITQKITSEILPKIKDEIAKVKRKK